LVDQAAIGGEGGVGDAGDRIVETLAAAPRAFLQACDQGRGGDRVEIGGGAFARSIFGGDDLALFGDPEPALDGARGLGEDRAEAGAAAAPDRAAAAVEELEAGRAFREQV